MSDYGYARCSLSESKQDIHRQTRELAAMRIKEENIFWEYESGTKDDRVQLNRLMEIVREGDTITSLEVSRLTRSTQKLCEIIKEVQAKKIKLIIAGSLTVDCTPGKELDPLTKGMLMMWGVFAELEHGMIVQRVKSGMENARAKGKDPKQQLMIFLLYSINLIQCSAERKSKYIIELNNLQYKQNIDILRFIIDNGMLDINDAQNGGRVLKKRKSKRDLENIIIDYYKNKKEILLKDIFQEWVSQKLEYGEIQKQTFDRYTTDFNLHQPFKLNIVSGPFL